MLADNPDVRINMSKRRYEDGHWSEEMLPAWDELYSDPSYWEDYYTDDRQVPDWYEIWPTQQEQANNGMHLEED